jgi:hypothetical protein
MDDLPFKERFAFYLELYPHDRVPNLSYARMAYYYAPPGTVDDHVAITDEDVRMLDLPPDWQPVATFGMHGAEFHPVEDLLAPEVLVTRERGNLWAGSELVVWEPTAIGEELELRFVVAEEGEYALHLACALDDSSGRVGVRLDGAPLDFPHHGELDLYVPHRKLARQFTSAKVELAAGEHVLTLVYEGAPESVATPRIGLDFLAVQPR